MKLGINPVEVVSKFYFFFYKVIICFIYQIALINKSEIKLNKATIEIIISQ